MTEQELIEIVRTIRKVDASAFLDTPIEDTPLDSLDLMELRAAVETKIGRSLADRDFLATRNLRALLRLINK